MTAKKNPPPGVSTDLVLLPWLTLEASLYLVIVAVAVGLRFWRLGAYPLSDLEATQSLTALTLYRGDLPEATGYGYSPLIVSLNALSFLLFGASDVSARLGSLLLGTMLVILPITLRRQLGSLVCLIAAAVLALSPISLYLSRTINSEIAVAAGALMIVTGFFNWVEAKLDQQGWLLLAAGGLAMLLAAGAMAYSILIIFGLLVLIRWSAFKALWTKAIREQPHRKASSLRLQDEVAELAFSETNNLTDRYTIPVPSVTATGATADRQQKKVVTPAETYANLRQAGLFLGALLILFGTTALFNLSGFSLVTGAIGDWLSRFSFEPRPDAGFNAVFLLTIYEPLLVVGGLVGLTLVLLRGNLPAMVFAGWLIGALLLDAVMIGRPNSNAMLIVVPLAFLAGVSLAQLWQNIRLYGSWNNEGLLTLTGLVIAGFGYIGLTAWLSRVCAQEDTACLYAWLQPVAAIILFVIIALFFAYLSDIGVALRGTALVGVGLGLLMIISFGWRLNYGPLLSLAYQPLAGLPASTELVNLTDTLLDESARRVGDETLLDTTLSGVDSPALRWRLRNFHHLNLGGLTEATPTQAIITPTETELNLAGAYFGQDFTLDAAWSPVGLQPKTLLEWFIYRQVNIAPQGNQVILWLRWENN